MEPNQVRLRCLELAIDNTPDGAQWDAIIRVAGKFHMYVLDIPKVAGQSEE